MSASEPSTMQPISILSAGKVGSSATGISNSFQILQMTCLPSYSYQTNQSVLQLPENQTPDGLIQEIETPSSSEEREADGTSMQYAPQCDSTTASACVETSDVDSHMYSLSVFVSNASRDAMVDRSILAVAIENNEASPTSVTISVFHPSEVPRWELRLSQLSERLVYSPMTLSGHDHLSMSMIQIPEILTSLNGYALTQGSLTWSFAKTEYKISYKLNCTFRGRRRLCKKIVYILREDIGLVTEFVASPLHKFSPIQSLHVAVDKANLVSQTQCCGHPEVSPSHVFHGYYIYTVYNMEQTMHLLCCDSHQLFERQAEIGLGLTMAEHLTAGRSGRPVKRNQKYNALRKVLKQPANKSKYRGSVQESHRGPSKLELAKEWNAFINAPFKSTRFSSIQVLKSGEVTIGARQQQSSSNQQNYRNRCDSEIFHQQMLTCTRPVSSNTRSGQPMRTRVQTQGHKMTEQSNAQHESQSHVRGDEAFVEECYEIRVVDAIFSAREITQLLHASNYDEIIQQLKNIPSNLPPESLIPTHFIIGVAYFKTFKYKEAKTHFKTCAALAEEAHQDGDVMFCNVYLGDMECASRSYLEATKYYKKAVKHYTSGSVALMFKLTPPSISAIHAKIASAFRNASMMLQAIQRYRTAISEAKTDRDQLSAHISLGNLYHSMGDNINALREYKESIRLAEILSDHVSLGRAHGNIGNVYLGLNKKDEALQHLQKSLVLAVEYEQTPQAIGRTYNNLGTAYQSINDLDKAEEYYDLALSQAVYGNDLPGQARMYGNIGNVHMLRKNYERAILHYSEVLELSNDLSTVSTARHNKGYAYYYWATSIQQNHSTDNDNTMKIHGPKCNTDTCLSNLSTKAIELYHNGVSDLEEVVKYQEERLQFIKGSTNGQALSVSLFESNCHTFHCLQDCLFNLHMFERALLVAEQSRARTLGELLLKRKGKDSMKPPLKPPLKFDQITNIVKSLPSPLIYFSYTGARLICWIFLPSSGQLTMYTFDRPLTDDQFDGKSFDYHLRYSLTEKLVEHSFEMYQHINYDSEFESSIEMKKLYNLICEPIQNVLLGHNLTDSQLTIISDSYTALLPLTCLQDPKSNSFFGDHYYFNSVPSLLMLDIMNQSADTSVDLEDAKSYFCIVGDPNIPPFKYNDELWYLGRLPYARREAEWVAHTLQTTPIFSEHATKIVILSRLQKAKIVHIATHGSASAGFLAFAAYTVNTNNRECNTVDASNVLLFPEEVEKLRISPALVVLSSCDSGRGTVKADGIQGMARAFILAGAQSVLTTLWKVPDESASVFMQFFYQYLIKGIQSSLALQKAIHSVRCFTKYSQYIHWGGYQLTGRNIRFSKTLKPLSMIVQSRLDKPSVFPRLPDVKKLEKLIKDPIRPTDVQILQGYASLNPSEVVKDFILSSYTHFSGGIFWISCHQPDSTTEYIIQKLDLINLTMDESHQVLFVFDGMTQLPMETSLLQILRNNHVHIVAVYNSFAPLDKLIREIDQKLVRGCAIHNIEPLTMIHSTQRMVLNVMEKFDFTPTNADQRVFEKLAELTLGSPLIIDMTVQLMIDCLKSMQSEGIQYLSRLLQLEGSLAEKSDSPNLFDSMKKLIACCKLSCEEQLLLNSLATYAGGPVPLSLVTEMSRLITQASQQPHLTGTLHQKLISHKLLLQYPIPVIVNPVLQKSIPADPKFELVYVPQHIAQYLCVDMEPIDNAAALSIAYHAMYQLVNTKSDSVCGASSLLYGRFEVKECYRQFFRLYLLESDMYRAESQPDPKSTGNEQTCVTTNSAHETQPDCVSTSSSVNHRLQETEGAIAKTHSRSDRESAEAPSSGGLVCQESGDPATPSSLHVPQPEANDQQESSEQTFQLSGFQPPSQGGQHTDLQDVENRFMQLIKWKDHNGVINNLRIYSKIAHMWRQIANLLGFEPGEIKTVENNYHGDDSRITTVFRRWFENANNLPNASCYPKSWQGLINLLNDAELGKVAEELQQALKSPWNNVRNYLS